MTKAVLLAAAALVAATGFARANTYVVDHWPGDIDTIPCEAWTHTKDGTWALNGSLKLGASDIEHVGVKDDPAARSLDRRCGK